MIGSRSRGEWGKAARPGQPSPRGPGAAAPRHRAVAGASPCQLEGLEYLNEEDERQTLPTKGQSEPASRSTQERVRLVKAAALPEPRLFGPATYKGPLGDRPPYESDLAPKTQVLPPPSSLASLGKANEIGSQSRARNGTDEQCRAPDKRRTTDERVCMGRVGKESQHEGG